MTILNYKSKILFILSLIVFNLNSNIVLSVGDRANEHRKNIGKYHAKNNTPLNPFRFTPRINCTKALPYLALSLLYVASTTMYFTSLENQHETFDQNSIDTINTTTNLTTPIATSNNTASVTPPDYNFNNITQNTANVSAIDCFHANISNGTFVENTPTIVINDIAIIDASETNGSELALYDPQSNQHNDSIYASFCTDDEHIQYFNDLIKYNKVEISGLIYEFINPDDSYANLIKKSFFDKKTAIKLTPSNREITDHACSDNKHPNGSIEIDYDVIINKQKSKMPLKMIVYKNTPYFSSKINDFNLSLNDLLSDGKFQYHGYEYVLSGIKHKLSYAIKDIETIKLTFDNFVSVELIFTHAAKNTWGNLISKAQLFVDDILINEFEFTVNKS